MNYFTDIGINIGKHALKNPNCWTRIEVLLLYLSESKYAVLQDL